MKLFNVANCLYIGNYQMFSRSITPMMKADLDTGTKAVEL